MSKIGNELIAAFAGRTILTIDLHAGNEKLVFHMDDGTTISIVPAGREDEGYLDIRVEQA